MASVALSSASMLNIHLWEALSTAHCFCSFIPIQRLKNTLSVYPMEISTVLSVLPESTTMISSAHFTLSRQSPIFSSSLCVIMVTDIFTLSKTFLRFDLENNPDDRWVFSYLAAMVRQADHDKQGHPEVGLFTQNY